MTKVLRSVAFACSFALTACAIRPPEPATQAQLASPHRVMVDAPRNRVPVDADTTISAPVVISANPVALLVGAAITIGSVAVQSAMASNNASRRDVLTAGLGETAPVAAEFSGIFGAELRRQLAGVPGLRVARFDEATPDSKPLPQDGAVLAISRDLMLSADGRQLVGRATTIHTVGEGSTRRSVTRYVLVLSDPVQATTDAEAAATWAADGGRLLRERARAVAAETAATIRLAVLSTDPLDAQTLPRARLRTPGVAVELGSEQRGGGGLRASTNMDGYLLRLSEGRAIVLALVSTTGGGPRGGWTWLSVPAANFAGDASG